MNAWLRRYVQMFSSETIGLDYNQPQACCQSLQKSITKQYGMNYINSDATNVQTASKAKLHNISCRRLGGIFKQSQRAAQTIID